MNKITPQVKPVPNYHPPEDFLDWLVITIGTVHIISNDEFEHIMEAKFSEPTNHAVRVPDRSRRGIFTENNHKFRTMKTVKRTLADFNVAQKIAGFTALTIGVLGMLS